MKTQDLGRRTSSTPAYSLIEEKNAKQQHDSNWKVQDEVKRMIELQTLEFPFDKAALMKSKPSGEIPSETTGRFNKTQA